MNKAELLEEVFEQWSNAEYGDDFEDWLNDEIVRAHAEEDDEVTPEANEDILKAERIEELYRFINSFGHYTPATEGVFKAYREVADLLRLA